MLNVFFKLWVFCATVIACKNYKKNFLSNNNPHIAAVVLARGGSKSIPLKNLATVGGIPLLTRSLKEIRKVPGFNSIWVSTDHDLIYQEAIKSGVNVHWRSPETATDHASSVLALQEFLKHHAEVDVVALVQCTSPFIQSKYLRQAQLGFISGNRCAFSATRLVLTKFGKAHLCVLRNFQLRWVEEGEEIVPANFNPKHRPRRQDLKGELVENGMFYISWRQDILRGYLQTNSCSVVEVPPERSLDVDDSWDLTLANLIHDLPRNDHEPERSLPHMEIVTTTFDTAYHKIPRLWQITPFYREAFETCSINGDTIRSEVFKELLSACSLDTAVMKDIWDIAGPSQGFVARTNFYKALALIAWAQEGKPPSEKLFENFSGKEYPVPTLGDLAPVKSVKAQFLKINSAVLGLSYKDIKQLDYITVELVPEKKGLILKYSEYVVTSRRFNSSVTRRYNDFLALHELLLARFPYRIIPRLPPKKMVSDSQFLESRRRALQRWLTLVCRHPSICQDALLSFFLTDVGSNVQHRIRDVFRRAPDEFMTSDVAATAKNLLPSDCFEFASSRERVRSLVMVVSRLKQLIEAGVERSQAYARDSEDFAHQLKALESANLENLLSERGRGMQRGLSLLAEKLLSIPSKASYHANVEQVTVCERLDLLLDILVGHRDLCERLERGLANDHQAALAKLLSLKKRRIQGVIRGADTESVEQLEARVLTQENVISNMELRSDFSLYCVHMETQLIQAYLETLSTILFSFVCHQTRSHGELTDVWKQVLATVESHFPCEDDISNGSKS